MGTCSVKFDGTPFPQDSMRLDQASLDPPLDRPGCKAIWKQVWISREIPNACLSPDAGVTVSYKMRSVFHIARCCRSWLTARGLQEHFRSTKDLKMGFSIITLASLALGAAAQSTAVAYGQCKLHLDRCQCARC